MRCLPLWKRALRVTPAMPGRDQVRPRRASGALSALVFCGLLIGCKPDSAVRENAAAGGGSKTAAALPAGVPIDAATAGSITGVVTLTGKAPERTRIDMSQDPVCSMTGGENDAEQYVVSGGKLANVYVYVKRGPEAAMKAATRRTSLRSSVAGRWSFATRIPRCITSTPCRRLRATR